MVRFLLRSSPWLLLSLLLLSFAHAADPSPPPRPPEIPVTTPIYARVALPPHGEQVLLLKLRTDGACKARNVLFADTNFNGEFEASEKCDGNVASREIATAQVEFTSCAFRFEVPLPAGGEVTGGNQLMVQSTLIEQAKSPPHSQSYVMINTTANRGQERWGYGSVVMLPHSPRMDCRPVGFTGGDTKLMVETRPDTQKPGHTGFAVRVSAPGYGIHEVCKDGPTVKVALRVANAKGETVHQDTVEMSKLAFG